MDSVQELLRALIKSNNTELQPIIQTYERLMVEHLRRFEEIYTNSISSTNRTQPYIAVTARPSVLLCLLYNYLSISQHHNIAIYQAIEEVLKMAPLKFIVGETPHIDSSFSFYLRVVPIILPRLSKQTSHEEKQLEHRISTVFLANIMKIIKVLPTAEVGFFLDSSFSRRKFLNSSSML